MKTIFLDTNIIIDFYAKRESFFESASIIFELAQRKEINIVVSSLSFVNGFYLLKKFFDKEQLKQKMTALSELCCISDISRENIKKALASEYKDFEDCVQMQSAKNLGINIIVTRNKKDFFSNDIAILTPIEFLVEFAKEKERIKNGK